MVNSFIYIGEFEIEGMMESGEANSDSEHDGGRAVERELQGQGDVHDWEFLLAEIKKQIDYLEWIRKQLERHPEFFTTRFMNAFLKYMTICERYRYFPRELEEEYYKASGSIQP
jgi:hypothetical protein